MDILDELLPKAIAAVCSKSTNASGGNLTPVHVSRAPARIARQISCDCNYPDNPAITQYKLRERTPHTSGVLRLGEARGDDPEQLRHWKARSP